MLNATLAASCSAAKNAFSFLLIRDVVLNQFHTAGDALVAGAQHLAAGETLDDLADAAAAVGDKVGAHLGAHLVGDPTYKWVNTATPEIDINKVIISEANNNAFWLDIIKNNKYAATGSDWIAMAVRKLADNNYENIEKFLATFAKKFPQMPVVMHDERFTSVLAQRAMIEGGVKKMQRREKGLADTISASIILQSYLDSNL